MSATVRKPAEIRLAKPLVVPILPPAPQDHAQLWLPQGKPRAFGQEDIALSGLASGWAQCEPGHAWTDGFDATLLLATPRTEREMTLIIEAEPYVTRQNPVQDVTLFLNGARAGFWRLSHRRVTALTTWIDPAWWRQSDQISQLRAVFHLPQSVSPAELGDGQDQRCLGLSFRRISLHP